MKWLLIFCESFNNFIDIMTVFQSIINQIDNIISLNETYTTQIENEISLDINNKYDNPLNVNVKIVHTF